MEKGTEAANVSVKGYGQRKVKAVVARFEADGLLEFGDRFVQPTLLLRETTPTGVGPRRYQVNFDHHAEVAEGFIRLAAIFHYASEPQINRRAVWPQGDEDTEETSGLIRLFPK